MTGQPYSTPKHGAQETVRISDVLRDKTILLIGSTGFVGKVYLFLLFRRHVDVAKVYCLIRPKPGIAPADRLRNEVLTSPAFDPLREVMGADAFNWIALSKLEAVEGDIGLPNLGLSDAHLTDLRGNVDVIVNSSGLVDFNPPLEEALSVNAIGIQHVVDVAEHWQVPLLHVSTCYVAGLQSGTIFEDGDLVGWFPRKGKLEGAEFDPQRELREGMQISAQVREESTHQDLRAQLVHEAKRRLKDEARNADDEAALAVEIDRAREKWINKRLTEYGLARAKHFGWSNTYTYTNTKHCSFINHPQHNSQHNSQLDEHEPRRSARVVVGRGPVFVGIAERTVQRPVPAQKRCRQGVAGAQCGLLLGEPDRLVQGSHAVQRLGYGAARHVPGTSGSIADRQYVDLSLIHI